MNKIRCRTVPFEKDTAPDVVQRVLPVLAEALAAAGLAAEQGSRTLMSMWSKGSMLLIEQYDADAPEPVTPVGLALLMVTRSLLYPTDSVITLLHPAPEHARQLIEFAVNVATAHGCAGISVTLPDQPASYAHLDVLAALGFSAKSVIFGKGLS